VQPDLKHEAMSVEERKLQLEEKKHALEQAKFEHGSRGLKFFNDNFGIIITAMIGGATVMVSYFQLEISERAGRSQLQVQKAISDAQLELEKSKAHSAKEKDERAFQFDVARLLLEKQNEINTQEVRGIYYMRDVVISTLPNEIGSRITRKMADMAASERLRAAWNDGYVQLQLSAAVSTQQGAGPTAAGPTARPVHVITTDFVLAQFPQINQDHSKQHLAAILEEARQSDLDVNATAILLAVVLYNTNNFKYFDDWRLDMAPDVIRQAYPQVLEGRPNSDPLFEDRRALANFIYRGRNGNKQPEDGWKYRKRGSLQLDGRGRYTVASSLVQVDLEATPDELSKSEVDARFTVSIMKKFYADSTLHDFFKAVTDGLSGVAIAQANYEKLMPGSRRVTEGLTIEQRGARAGN
jgi:predicted chitinase